jgi:hypothetical protein
MDVLFLDAARTSWVMPLKPARGLKYDEIASGDSGDLKLSHQLLSVGKYVGESGPSPALLRRATMRSFSSGVVAAVCVIESSSSEPENTRELLPSIPPASAPINTRITLEILVVATLQPANTLDIPV